MSDEEQPQIYLILPPTIEVATFPDLLGRVLDAEAVACLRLDLSSRDEYRIARAADACREVAHARDVAIVINDHVALAERLGLDGVHLSDAGRSVRGARKPLGADAIVGSFCGASRHDGMSAGEAGADYVSFGPMAGALGDGTLAEAELFAWWSEIIEVPVVAEGGITLEVASKLKTITDFIALGDEIWEHDDPSARLSAFVADLG